ncbi:T9SS type A sorting domain-containing protein [Marivirga sp. S37H4]|uniref:T9SS type A sorting domain-containing protein n=1 Tax=Marivirga aurantiaca TaxID=2802615 RepID=A0A935CCW4_9BACT|nr:T9SS type A sorting domain-containing protein [Marivirga aurantiaca]MBK6266353.1 T9SS type A sorting domain-containing protein [Marivirga aurantiaca]
MNHYYKLILVLTTNLLLSNIALSQVFDETFKPAILGNSLIKEIVPISEERNIIVGDFFYLNGEKTANIAVVNSDGSKDPNFKIDEEELPEGEFFTAFYDAEINKIYGGGHFESGIGLIRFNMDGSIDQTFNAFSDCNNVHHIRKQSTGKIVVFTTNFPETMYRLTSTGELDNSFQGSTGPSTYTTASITFEILENDKIIFGGDFENFNGEANNTIVLLNEDGTIDENFDIGAINQSNGGNAMVSNINPLTDGRYFISGSFSSIQGNDANNYAIIDETGKSDPSFTLQGQAGSTFTGNVSSTITNDNHFILHGRTSFSNALVSKVDLNGNFVSNFNKINLSISTPEGYYFDYNSIVLNGQNFYTAGQFNSSGTLDLNRTLKADLNGNIVEDYTVQIGYKASINDALLLENGKTLIVGEFTKIDNTETSNIALINPDGSVDTEFINAIGTGIDGVPRSLVKASDGSVIVTGRFDSFNGNTVNNIMKISTSGVLDESFEANLQTISLGIVGNDILELANEKIIVTGHFNYVNGEERHSIAMLNLDGSLDLNFDASNLLETNSTVNAIAIKDNETIVIAGEKEVNNESFLMELNTNGELVFDYMASNDIAKYSVSAISVLSNNSIIASSYNKETFNDWPLLQFNTEGILVDETSINSSQNSFNTMMPINDSTLYVGGQFLSINGYPIEGFAKIGLDGQVYTDFDYGLITPGDYAGASINKIINYNENQLLICGAFLGNEDFPLFNMGILNIAAPLTPQNLNVSFDFENGNSITWNSNDSKLPQFEIYKKSAADNFVVIDTSSAETYSFIDDNINLKEDYVYKIRAINSGFYSQFTDEISILTDSILPINSANFDFNFLAGTEITMPVPAKEYGTDHSITLYKSSDSENFTEVLTSVNIESLNYTDNEVELNKEYEYKTKSTVGIFTSEFSNTFNYTTPESAFLEVPYELNTNIQNDQITISWEYDQAVLGFEVLKLTGTESEFGVADTVETTTFNDQDIELFQTYNYKIKAFNAFESSDYAELESALITAQSERLSSKLKAFPVPATDKLSISMDGTKIQNIHLINTQGKIVLKQTAEKDNLTLDIKSLEKGIYLLKVISNGEYAIKRIVKE